MKIGLDLSVIQTPHRMRGIGSVAINFVKNITEDQKKQHTFVLFLYEEEQEEALSILELSGLTYEVQTLLTVRPIKLRLPGRLRRVNSLLNAIRGMLSIFTGDPRLGDISSLDAFLQFEQTRPLPREKGVRKALVLYDIIPYVMESDYLWSYGTARRKQLRRRTALKKGFERWQYIFKNKHIPRQADHLIAISQHTKNDFIKYMGFKDKQIDVVHLGVDVVQTSAVKEEPSFEKYVRNSWGYFPHATTIGDKPFLLFVGGADPRRKLIDLVAAYNNLRAQGYDVRLVLVGDTMKGPEAIPVRETQKYLSQSSYLDGIIFLGFVTDHQKDWLYSHATAFVYPSLYEGFGLPVLEAMNYGTRVITYDNTSIREVAGELPIYASNFHDIFEGAKELLNTKDGTALKKYRVDATKHLEKFTWKQTTSRILSLLD